MIRGSDRSAPGNPHGRSRSGLRDGLGQWPVAIMKMGWAQMAQKTVGIIFSGATGRLAQHQHLRNALLPILSEDGIPTANGDRILLVGRDDERLKAVSEAT